MKGTLAAHSALGVVRRLSCVLLGSGAWREAKHNRVGVVGGLCWLAGGVDLLVVAVTRYICLICFTTEYS